MQFVILLFLVFTSLLVTAQSNPSVVLAHSSSIFNADTCCWRKLSTEGHDAEAGQLILSYYKANKKAANKHALYWHAGQCFAMAEQHVRAKKYMSKTYSPFYRWFGGADGRTWYYYANGTVAFLERNKKKLEKMIHKWGTHYPQDLNYQALTALLKHWERPYKEIKPRR